MTGNIYISGQIGTFDGVTGTELIDVIGQVKKQPQATAFNVHINSEGGLVDVGFDIYHYLRSLGKPITTIGSGIVASIATVVFMAGSKRVVRENTPFMIHLPWGGSMGTADEIEQFADQLRAIETKMVGFYKKALHVQEQAILPLLKNETWLSGTQLTALGFTTSQHTKIAAKAFINPKTIMRGTLTERDRHWMEGLFSRVLAKFKHTNAYNKIVQDATGAELDFIELPDDGIIELGATATVAGMPAEGEYMMPDGATYVFEAGELVEIIEAEEGDDMIETAALRAENKALKRQLNTIKGEVLALKRQVGSRYSLDGKKVAARKPSQNDKLAGMKQYLQNKNRK
ncbi:Clp protease ClpP [Flavobacterium litorale]|uniref:Clp protease ClpP n=1 Tax=Flavobacterium litorale TaxID=2856519 RepID=A0ABX8V9X0_9FLAO|nr:Clp protease ClpP [Flavobacterium litorale]QYJ68933.1 Clp protease ClpP [Flavobacterium litorale]